VVKELRNWEYEKDITEFEIECPFSGGVCRGCLCMAWISHPSIDSYGTCSRLQPVVMDDEDLQ